MVFIGLSILIARFIARERGRLVNTCAGTLAENRNGGVFAGHCSNTIKIVIGDILRTVLALYMDDENLPLPTLEEVLICDSTTTAEEV